MVPFVTYNYIYGKDRQDELYKTTSKERTTVRKLASKFLRRNDKGLTEDQEK